jgi:hypothetical protein
LGNDHPSRLQKSDWFGERSPIMIAEIWYVWGTVIHHDCRNLIDLGNSHPSWFQKSYWFGERSPIMIAEVWLVWRKVTNHDCRNLIGLGSGHPSWLQKSDWFGERSPTMITEIWFFWRISCIWCQERLDIQDKFFMLTLFGLPWQQVKIKTLYIIMYNIFAWTRRLHYRINNEKLILEIWLVWGMVTHHDCRNLIGLGNGHTSWLQKYDWFGERPSIMITEVWLVWGTVTHHDWEIWLVWGMVTRHDCRNMIGLGNGHPSWLQKSD